MSRSNAQVISSAQNTNLPPIILDIEASGFASDSYPIEIGVVTSEQKLFCRLIKPLISWSHWSENAEKLHGISRELLAQSGAAPANVCEELNVLLKGRKVYSDAWVWDSQWLSRLYYDSGIEKTFYFSSIESLMSEEQMSIWDEEKLGVIRASEMTRHRASADALVIQQTYTQSLQKIIDRK